MNTSVHSHINCLLSTGRTLSEIHEVSETIYPQFVEAGEWLEARFTHEVITEVEKRMVEAALTRYFDKESKEINND